MEVSQKKWKKHHKQTGPRFDGP